MQYEHEIALSEYGLQVKGLPRTLGAKITLFNNHVKSGKKSEKWLKSYSAVIADEIQSFIEKDLPEEEIPEISSEYKEQLKASYAARRARKKENN